MIYFDNAATTFPKPKGVIEAVSSCISDYCGNPGRGSHILARASAEAVYDTREKIAWLLNLDTPENVVFTYNATYALNLAIKTLIKENCHVITSDIEHNAVIRPLEKLKRTIGIDYSLFDSDGDIEENIRKLIRTNTACIISTLASNVNGKPIPLKLLSSLSAEYGIKLIIDASQYIGYHNIDLKESPCDVLCAPAHKSLYGIQGCGFAVFKESKIKDSFIEGGSGTDSKSPFMPSVLPEGYEAGTLSTPAIVGLRAGIEFINFASIYSINSKIYCVSTVIKDRISTLSDLVLYPSYGSVIAFNHKSYDSEKLCSYLDSQGICLRGGLHCAPSAHKKLGTLDRGCARISLSYFNEEKDAEGLFLALKKL